MAGPAENTLPAPAITATRTSSSALIAAAQAVRSAIICSLNALRTSGRLRVRYSTTPSRRVRSVSYTSWFSHPEHAEPGRWNRRVEARREREGQHGAGLRRIQDAIVPQTGGRVIGRAFQFVLVENRLPDPLILLGRELPVLAGQLLALDRREHACRLLATHDGNARVRPHPEKPRL